MLRIQVDSSVEVGREPHQVGTATIAGGTATVSLPARSVTTLVVD